MPDRRRRRKEQRAQRREEQRKAQTRRELLRRLGFALGMGALLVAAFVVVNLLTRGDDSLPSTYVAYRSQESACGAEAPPEEMLMAFSGYEPQPDITADAVVIATISTSCGDIVIELDPANYPETVQSFVFLARQGFYDGTVFHRIVPDFVIQGGDPQAVGTGGPGYRIPDEWPGDDFVYEPGIVAMANNGRNTTGSQFFIVVGEDARVLAPQFNVLGRVVAGEDTLEAIAAVPTGTRTGSRERSLPLQTVYIESVEIEVG